MTDERDDEAPVIKVTDKRRFADLERVEAGEMPASTPEEVLRSRGYREADIRLLDEEKAVQLVTWMPV